MKRQTALGTLITKEFGTGDIESANINGTNVASLSYILTIAPTVKQTFNPGEQYELSTDSFRHIWSVGNFGPDGKTEGKTVPSASINLPVGLKDALEQISRRLINSFSTQPVITIKVYQELSDGRSVIWLDIKFNQMVPRRLLTLQASIIIALAKTIF